MEGLRLSISEVSSDLLSWEGLVRIRLLFNWENAASKELLLAELTALSYSAIVENFPCNYSTFSELHISMSVSGHFLMAP